MDRGLATAVTQFGDIVGDALAEAASGTSVGRADLGRDAVVEAFNLSVAVMHADGRHTDDELWALVAAFAPFGLVPAGATPGDLRRSNLFDSVTGLDGPSPLFDVLAGVDRSRGTTLAKRYYDAAMRLVHVVASLDRFPSEAELTAIVGYQKTLLDALPTGKPTPPAAATADPGADPAVAAAEAAIAAETPPPPPEPLDDVLAELDELIGLDAVKEEVRLLSALLRVQKLRKERDLPVVETNRHLVFSGNPGTGKTTVARLLARIYRSLGVVEQGHLTEVDRGGLVAGFVGQTAPKVAEVFEAADGGVLLIDEAYSLIRGGDKDFGREAIDAIVKQVEDRRDSLVVILAGYPKEMAELVAANPGFQSRFPKTILFPDYTDPELVAILELIAGGSEYDLTDDTRAAAEVWFAAHPRGPGFGNGRLARNLFEAAVARHATRLVEVADPTDAQLTTLEPEDVAAVPVSADDPTAGSSPTPD